MSGKQKVSVLNPQGYPPKIVQRGMADRSKTLEGRPVYLVDCRFDDADRLLLQMQKWFKENMPEVRTEFVQKSGTYHYEDKELFEEIKAKGGAAVLAVGH